MILGLFSVMASGLFGWWLYDVDWRLGLAFAFAFMAMLSAAIDESQK
jgi:hypothetical protein